MNHNLSSLKEKIRMCAHAHTHTHTQPATENEAKPWLELEIFEREERKYLCWSSSQYLPSWTLGTRDPPVLIHAVTTLLFSAWSVLPYSCLLINLASFLLVSRLLYGHSGRVWHFHSPAGAAIVLWPPPTGILPPKHLRGHHLHWEGQLWGRHRGAGERGLQGEQYHCQVPTLPESNIWQPAASQCRWANSSECTVPAVAVGDL